MNYMFKLARRLAHLRDAIVVAAPLITLSCTAGDDLGTTGPGSIPSSADTSNVTISPGAISVGVNQTVQFEAVTHTSSGIWGPLTWTATGGTVDGSGKYTSGKVAGKYRVIAAKWKQATGSTWEGVADTAAVTITTIAQIVLSPASISLPPRGSQQFTAEGKSADGATVPVTSTYAATGGTISSAGVYTAGDTPGTFQVIAMDTVSARADTSVVTITAPSPTLEAVVLTPATIALQTGGAQQFAAIGRMSDGSTTTVGVTYSATGGSITGTGLY